MSHFFPARHEEDTVFRLIDWSTQVMTNEWQLTWCALRHGKDSPAYRQALREFATAWDCLRQLRDPAAFHLEVFPPLSE